MTRLFVYGSLKSGLSGAPLMHGAEFLGSTETEPKYSLRVYEGYPALGPGDQSISGEIYKVNEAVLARLDEYEDAPTVYFKAEVELSKGAPAISYFLSAVFWQKATPTNTTQWAEKGRIAKTSTDALLKDR